MFAMGPNLKCHTAGSWEKWVGVGWGGVGGLFAVGTDSKITFFFLNQQQKFSRISFAITQYSRGCVFVCLSE